jgi:hypothetical protein
MLAHNNPSVRCLRTTTPAQPAAQHSAAQRSSAQHSTAHLSAAQHSTAQLSPAPPVHPCCLQSHRRSGWHADTRHATHAARRRPGGGAKSRARAVRAVLVLRTQDYVVGWAEYDAAANAAVLPDSSHRDLCARGGFAGDAVSQRIPAGDGRLSFLRATLEADARCRHLCPSAPAPPPRAPVSHRGAVSGCGAGPLRGTALGRCRVLAQHRWRCARVAGLPGGSPAPQATSARDGGVPLSRGELACGSFARSPLVGGRSCTLCGNTNTRGGACTRTPRWGGPVSGTARYAHPPPRRRRRVLRRRRGRAGTCP